MAKVEEDSDSKSASSTLHRQLHWRL